MAETYPMPCPICGYMVKDEDDKKTHMINAHPESAPTGGVDEHAGHGGEQV